MHARFRIREFGGNGLAMIARHHQDQIGLAQDFGIDLASTVRAGIDGRVRAWFPRPYRLLADLLQPRCRPMKLL